jgi:hypothetical protein
MPPTLWHRSPLSYGEVGENRPENSYHPTARGRRKTPRRQRFKSPGLALRSLSSNAAAPQLKQAPWPKAALQDAVGRTKASGRGKLLKCGGLRQAISGHSSCESRKDNILLVRLIRALFNARVTGQCKA